MSDAYCAGKYHAETNQPSLLASFTPRCFGWFDYLEGQRAGFNEMFWYHTRCTKDTAEAERYEALRKAVNEQLKEVGR